KEPERGTDDQRLDVPARVAGGGKPGEPREGQRSCREKEPSGGAVYLHRAVKQEAAQNDGASAPDVAADALDEARRARDMACGDRHVEHAQALVQRVEQRLVRVGMV